MKKWLIAALAAVLIAGAGWYFASPALAMSGLRDAAMAGDKDELKERIDFPAVKESLKSQVKARMMAEAAKQKDNPMAGLGAMFAMAMIDPLIDGLISPDAIKAMVERGKLGKPDAEAQEPKPEPKWAIERSGLDTFRAVPESQDGKPSPKLVFKRDGLSWRLVDIEIPEDAMKPDSGV